MNTLSFTELYTKLRASDEGLQLEAKTTEQEVGSSAYETVSSFSNEPGRGGGYILFGVAPSSDPALGDYEVRGVTNPDKMQTEFATQCRTIFNATVRPIINVEQFNTKNVVVAFIPEAAPQISPFSLNRWVWKKAPFVELLPPINIAREKILICSFN